jgi:beta-phosphoglucomutase-like phosphatase (HAD superfamily)
LSPGRNAAVADRHLRAVLWGLDGTLTDRPHQHEPRRHLERWLDRHGPSPVPDAERTVRTWRELRLAVFALAGPKPGILGRRGPVRS